MGVGMPQALYLKAFGQLVREAFGAMPYHVGSSMTSKTGWRDVDVRLMLDDDEYAALGLGDPRYPHHSPKWRAMCMAFSALGREMTGLPIDFQIQQVSTANTEHDKPRSALFITNLQPDDPGSNGNTESK